MFIEPCILCGKQFWDKMQPQIISVGDYKSYFIVKCPKCGLSVFWDEAMPTKKQAIQLWNDRINNYKWKLKVRSVLLERRW